MKIKKNKLPMYLKLAILLILFTNCTTLIPDNNMKWTAQYNFMDLYKKKNGSFDPDANIELSLIFSPIENVIILGAQKDTPEFDPTATERQAVLYISTDRGQSYKELILEGNDVDSFVEFTRDYSIIRTSDRFKEYIYIFNNKSLHFKEVESYDREKDVNYNKFDGRYIGYREGKNRYMVDLLNKEDTIKRYEIPKELTVYQFYPIHQNGDILYYNKILELHTYNVITGEDKLFKQLKHKYDYFFPENYLDYNTPLSLQNVKNLNNRDTYEKMIYDLEENFVRKITKENREKYYYYKDFICDYTRLHAHSELRFSFDKGKTWKTHKIPIAGLLVFNKNVGFFEDKYIVFEGILFRGGGDDSGGRIMVGEFLKD